MRAVTMLFFVSCDAGVRTAPPAPNPEPLPVEVPAIPSDAAVDAASVDASATPTPAQRNLQILARVTAAPSEMECTRNSLQLRLVDNDNARKVVDQWEQTSTCSGACTAEDQRDGARHVRAVEAAIERGEASSSQLDYNFTGCLETGYGEHRLFRRVGGRDVVVFTDRYLGPHDGQYHRLVVAFEVCGKLFVSTTFGEHMAHSWDIDRVMPKAEGDGAISIFGEEEYQKGTLLRVHLPACPGAPREEAFDVHPIYE